MILNLSFKLKYMKQYIDQPCVSSLAFSNDFKGNSL